MISSCLGVLGHLHTTPTRSKLIRKGQVDKPLAQPPHRVSNPAPSPPTLMSIPPRQGDMRSRRLKEKSQWFEEEEGPPKTSALRRRVARKKMRGTRGFDSSTWSSSLQSRNCSFLRVHTQIFKDKDIIKITLAYFHSPHYHRAPASSRSPHFPLLCRRSALGVARLPEACAAALPPGSSHVVLLISSIRSSPWLQKGTNLCGLPRSSRGGSSRRKMTRCWLALVVAASLLCALSGDARKGDLDGLPSPGGDAVNKTAALLGEEKLVEEPAKVRDDKKGEGEAKASAGVEEKGLGDQLNGKAGKEAEVAGEDHKVGSRGDSTASSVVTKDGTAHVEECDAPNKCIDEKNKFVACLRVPGNDSPTLSLLIQNKGTTSLTVNILAPDYVTLEQNAVLLNADEDKKAGRIGPIRPKRSESGPARCVIRMDPPPGRGPGKSTGFDSIRPDSPDLPRSDTPQSLRFARRHANRDFYYLHPAYHYALELSYDDDLTAAFTRMKSFREGVGSFAEPSAIAGRDRIDGADWWFNFGHSTPILRKIVVKVTVEYGVNNTPILLSAGDGHCNLSFWDMIPSSIREAEGYSVPSHINFFIRSTFVYLALASVVLLGAAWLWVKFQRMHRLMDPRYQKLDGGLPVSSGGVMEKDDADWQKNWDGSWDDEEAPKTPSKTLSNPSSKGLASRKFNKDGWKD
ncbi:hypothetical protein Taro_027762 [Colocasia esculenta]|uniref:DUF7356 domain-containing protein n=1 Tax=Colocasia esculenta TaxID=4460 RepID=A0A843VGL6_COLES|nr:hypothetical protein [Colocasia esculenta]